tara:strand:+ start:878 stop:1228 length:351 start_codon:yes stop_codon:yes gene_type:complete
MNTLRINAFDLFNDAFFNEDYSFWRRRLNTPSWKDNGNQYELNIPLPGFKKQDVKGEVDEGVVTIKAKNENDSASYSFYLPETADPDSISTTLEDGLLSFSVEKFEKNKKIDIKIN